MKKTKLVILVLIGWMVSFTTVMSTQFLARTGDIVWSEQNKQGETIVHLYVYSSLDCPHCEKALPYIKELTKRYPWVKLHLREVSKNKRNLISLGKMAKTLNEPSFGEVPAFFFCGLMYTGYDENDTTGQWIDDTLVECRGNSG